MPLSWFWRPPSESQLSLSILLVGYPSLDLGPPPK